MKPCVMCGEATSTRSLRDGLPICLRCYTHSIYTEVSEPDEEREPE